MSDDLVERLLFHGRYATETQAECNTRKNAEREEAAANAALIVALVNAYRTGKLVLIDDGAVERVARAMAELHLPGSKKLWKMYVPLATAALAALGVK